MRSSDPALLDAAQRSAGDVLQDHLRLREAAELEEDLRRNYATDVVLLSARGVLRGHEGVRTSAAFLYEAAAGHDYRYHLTDADDRMAMLEWSATGRLRSSSRQRGSEPDQGRAHIRHGSEVRR